MALLPRPAAIRQVLVVALAAAVVTCGGGGGSDPQQVPSRIVATPSSLALLVGSEAQLSCTVEDADGEPMPSAACTYTTVNGAIATVSPAGLVSAAAEGSTSIAVRHATLEVLVPVSVTVPGPVPTTLTVTPNPVVVAQLHTTQLTAEVRDAQGNVMPIAVTSFTSLNESIVRMRPGALVESQGPGGETGILVVAAGLSVTVPVRVTQIPTRLRVTPPALVLGPGASQQLVGIVLDTIGQPIDTAVVSFSTNASVATITPAGFLSASATSGHGIVRATSGPLGTDVRFTVATPPAIDLVNSAFLADKLWTVAITPAGEAIVGSVDGLVGRVSIPVLGATTISNDGQPLGVAVDAGGQFAYVAGAADSVLGPIGVAVIDLASNARVAYLEHGDNGPPWSVAVCPDNNTVYVGTGTGRVMAFDAATRGWITTLTVAGAINHLLCSPATGRAYASSATLNGNIYEISTVTHTLTRTFAPTLPAEMQQMSLSATGELLYVVNDGIEAWDVATGTFAYRSLGNFGGLGMVPSVDKEWLFVCHWNGGSVVIVDAFTLVDVRTIPTGGFPRRIGITANGQYLVVVNQDGRVHLMQ